jgi:hypothetical protein
MAARRGRGLALFLDVNKMNETAGDHKGAPLQWTSLASHFIGIVGAAFMAARRGRGLALLRSPSGGVVVVAPRQELEYHHEQLGKPIEPDE